MSLKSSLRPYAPHWLIKMLQPDEFRSFRTYSDAMLSCGQSYQNESLTQVVVEKNIRLRDSFQKNETLELNASAMRTLLALSFVKDRKNLTVVDFGGGGGYHYWVARAFLPTEVKLSWRVIETEQMCKEAKRIENHELKFFPSIQNAVADSASVDLAFSSASLYFMPTPLQTLDELVQVNAQVLYVTRTPLLTEGHQYISSQKSLLSQNGPGALPPGISDQTVEIPITFVNQKEFEAVLLDRYFIRTKFTEDHCAYRAHGMPVHTYGYHCELKH